MHSVCNINVFPCADIRKLLENYVAYLSTLSDNQKEVRSTRQHSARHIMIQSSLSSHPPLPLGVDNTTESINQTAIFVDSTPLVGVLDNDPIGNSGSSTQYQFQLPITNELSMNLNDGELSKFIDKFLSSAESANYSSASDQLFPLSDENQALPNSSLEARISSDNPINEPNKVSDLEGTAEQSALQPISQSEATTPTTILLDAAFLRSPVLEDLANETVEDKVYTTDSGEEGVETSTRPDSMENTSAEMSTTEDNTPSNNFKMDFNEDDDTELLRELRKAKDLIRTQLVLLRQLNETLFVPFDQSASLENEVVSVGNDNDGALYTTSAPVTALKNGTAGPSNSTEFSDSNANSISDNLANGNSSERVVKTLLPGELANGDAHFSNVSGASNPANLTSANGTIHGTTSGSAMPATANDSIMLIEPLPDLTQGTALNRSELITSPGSATNVSSRTTDNSVSSDTETMILTHVPKITIIHKIARPSAGEWAGMSDDQIHNETVRKHTNLIQSAVSSISLYPAAFKHYKLNANNRLNSIGEIYLLPNFTNHKSIKWHAQPEPTDNRKRESWSFKNGAPATVDRLGNAPQAHSELKGMQITETGSEVGDQTNLTDPFFNNNRVPHKRIRMHRLRNGANGHRSGNKFNAITFSAPANSTVLSNSTNLNPGELDDVPIYFTDDYKNETFSRPENIIQLYRPRHQFIKHNSKDSVRASTGKSSNSIQITVRNETHNKKFETLSNTSPILIHVDNHNGSLATSHANESSTPNLIKSSKQGKLFKIFCSYDAEQALNTVGLNGSNGKYFDVGELELNPVVLEHCTHLIYAFAHINVNAEVLVGLPSAKDSDASTQAAHHQSLNELHKLIELKHKYRHLKLLVAVGGWSTPPQLLSLLVATTRLRERLGQNIHKFVLDHDFDGAILAWFYPLYVSKPVNASDSHLRNARSIGQTSFQLDDKQNLVKFIRSLRNRFDSVPNKRLDIGLMMPPFEELMNRGFDVDKLSE